MKINYRRLAGLAALAGLVVLFIKHPAYTPSTMDYTPDNKISMDGAKGSAVTNAIQVLGYNCPQAKLAYAKGADAYGNVVQVYCGPADIDGVYPNAKFRVTFRPSGRVSVAPWN